MKFGLLFRAQDPPDGKNLTRRWQEILRAGQLAEEVGFDGLFLPEHHMMDDGYTPAPLWRGAMSFPGVRRAARLGAPWPTDPLHNVHVIKEWADAYHAAGEEHGTTEQLSVSLLRDGWVADDLDQVERDWWPSIRSEHWFYFSQVPRWVADREPFLQGIQAED